MYMSTRLLIAANIVILNAIVLVFLVKSDDGPDNGLSECVQKTKSVELCATAYR